MINTNEVDHLFRLLTLMFAKLRACRLSNEEVSLLENYMCGRMQQVRVDLHTRS